MPPRQAARLFSSVTRPSRALSASVGRRFPYSATTLQPTTCRFAHSIPKPPSSTAQSPSAPSSSAAEGKPRKLLEPHYMLTFTCVPCGDRSQHYISKQGYHRGSVLITCPSCRNRHIISDNLNIFGNKKITVEDLMREKGQLVKRGSLGEDGDVEFWEDGTMTEHNPITGRKLPTEALAEEDVGDQEAKKMRDARDPSAQAAEVTPTAAHAPLSTAGARPSVDSTTQPHAVPSTRRQFSTTRYLKESPEQDLGVPRESKENEYQTEYDNPEDTAGESSESESATISKAATIAPYSSFEDPTETPKPLPRSRRRPLTRRSTVRQTVSRKQAPQSLQRAEVLKCFNTITIDGKPVGIAETKVLQAALAEIRFILRKREEQFPAGVASPAGTKARSYGTEHSSFKRVRAVSQAASIPRPQPAVDPAAGNKQAVLPNTPLLRYITFDKKQQVHRAYRLDETWALPRRYKDEKGEHRGGRFAVRYYRGRQRVRQQPVE